ncbi:MAG: flavodoxin family protein [Methanolinea sp.]|jgi:NAD(P)H-dependent FMN reductase|nr:flavodoxin family protein [Methanolinea sp.]
MKKALHQVKETTMGGRTFSLRMEEEDLGDIYPGMVRFSVELWEKENLVTVFRTNSFEYAPTMTYGAREAAERVFTRWERDLAGDMQCFLDGVPEREPVTHQPSSGSPDVVVIQGSPRPGGNCSILASWVAGEAQRLGKDVHVVYPHDLDIHPCIGCYQCYNTGTCVYADDMNSIIPAVERCRLLVVCTPVYTNTVPAGTKALLDRFQSLHASRTLDRRPFHRTRGLLLSVAGRKGPENFTCVSRVIGAFFSLVGIGAEEPVFIDGMDETRDIRVIPGLETRVRGAVGAALQKD